MQNCNFETACILDTSTFKIKNVENYAGFLSFFSFSPGNSALLKIDVLLNESFSLKIYQDKWRL